MKQMCLRLKLVDACGTNSFPTKQRFSRTLWAFTMWDSKAVVSTEKERSYRIKGRENRDFVG